MRKSTFDAWAPENEVPIAAQNVFEEQDGIHSFYRVGEADQLAAVAAFMTRAQDKPRPAYFFALPDDIVLKYKLEVGSAMVDGSRCPPLHGLHFHVLIAADKKGPIYREIRERSLFNYRVGKAARSSMISKLQHWGCLDHSQGPCNVEGCAAIAQPV